MWTHFVLFFSKESYTTAEIASSILQNRVSARELTINLLIIDYRYCVVLLKLPIATKHTYCLI